MKEIVRNRLDKSEIQVGDYLLGYTVFEPIKNPKEFKGYKKLNKSFKKDNDNREYYILEIIDKESFDKYKDKIKIFIKLVSPMDNRALDYIINWYVDNIDKIDLNNLLEE